MIQHSITLLGTSGVGKTTLAALLKQGGWYHYSGDYRIATRYLREPIQDWLRAQLREEALLWSLLQQDALKLEGKVRIDNLAILSAFVGKLGRDGYDFATFRERQALFATAEMEAMRDVRMFKKRAEALGFHAFINDAGGSICEIDDTVLLQDLAQETLFVYLDTDEALYQELMARAQRYPKPICYHPDFLEKTVHAYATQTGTQPDDFDSDAFIRFVMPQMMAHRRERCLRLAQQYGVVLNAREVWRLKSAAAFEELLLNQTRG